MKANESVLILIDLVHRTTNAIAAGQPDPGDGRLGRWVLDPTAQRHVLTRASSDAEEPPGATPPRWLLDPGGFFRDRLSSSTTYLGSLWSTRHATILLVLILAVASGLLLRGLRARAWQRARASAR